VLNQAVNSKIAQDGGLDCSMMTANDSPDAALELFNVNYEPYMKTTIVEKTQKGVAVGFPEGSGMYLRRTSNTGCPTLGNCGCTYVAFCTDYKKCKNINESSSTTVLTDGKDTFLFHTTGNTEHVGWNGTRAQALSLCSNSSRTWCAFLLQHDNWEVKDDYPVKF
jgi:hypothetical protein